MMNVQDAYKLVTRKFAGRYVHSCHEFDDRFVFCMIPENAIDDAVEKGILDSLWAVDKKSGKLAHFTPFDMEEGAYQRGKRITIYDRK